MWTIFSLFSPLANESKGRGVVYSCSLHRHRLSMSHAEDAEDSAALVDRTTGKTRGGKVSGQVITFSRQSYLPRIKMCVYDWVRTARVFTIHIHIHVLISRIHAYKQNTTILYALTCTLVFRRIVSYLGVFVSPILSLFLLSLFHFFFGVCSCPFGFLIFSLSFSVVERPLFVTQHVHRARCLATVGTLH